ncbi:MAG TPA: ATP-binding protein [Polyangiaceae bacterium]|jgi:two-component system phosphate regulon sensor histidine kinase PhoR|nr:ATP-binding protein [Polyangiaceae bacterium]
MKRSSNLGALGYRRLVIALVSLVVVPTALLITIGAILLFLGEAKVNVLMGILVLAFSGAAATGVVLVWVFAKREANLSQLQNDFVSKVSHELRTPLTSIRLFSDTLALGRSDADAQRKCIEGLQRESARLQALIDRLLDWGRMESGRREFEIRATDVDAIVADAISAVEPVRERLKAEITVELPPRLPHILADRAAMSDALLNLLTNACKYGGTPAKICLKVTEEGNNIKIVVTDNGSGIPVSEHKNIFQKFYRVDDRLARAQEGSGLGLAIVKHVMRAHGGRVEVRSAPGLGSSFGLVIPVARGV